MSRPRLWAGAHERYAFGCSSPGCILLDGHLPNRNPIGPHVVPRRTFDGRPADRSVRHPKVDPVARALATGLMVAIGRWSTWD